MDSRYLIVFLILTCSCRHNSNTNIYDSLPDSAYSESSLEKDTVDAPSDEIISGENAILERASAEDLNKLNDSILERLKRLDKTNPLLLNITGFGLTQKTVEIYLEINTEYWRNEFKKYVVDSPYLDFTGPDKPVPISSSVDTVAEIPWVHLTPNNNEYPADSEKVDFTLKNEGDKAITFGEYYIIAYQGCNNEWYILPNSGFCNDIGYELKPYGSILLKANLFPRLNKNIPGIYRLYKRIKLEGSKKSVWIMTEFHLK